MNSAEGNAPVNCPACGKPLQDQLVCPACILKRAINVGDVPPETSPRHDDSPEPLLASFLPPPSSAPPQELGDYQIHESLGEGGMGFVHRATKRSLRKIVAVKFIRSGAAASPRDRTLFLREAELASRLDHPHIVSVFEVGEHEGFPFLVMQFIDGRPLAERLQNPDFCPSTRGRIRLLIPILRAVHHAHQRGVIHRDLKPGNVLVDRDGTPFVSDFGLARWATHHSTVTHSEGKVIGTPAYMPPEQADGKRSDLTTAGDVWSFGVILYELLAGRLPFDAESVGAMVRQIVDRDPPPLFPSTPVPEASRRSTRSLPPSDMGRLSATDRRDLESICLRCLNKDPGSRYASTADLADDLNRWLDGKTVIARLPTTSERLGRWIRRHPATAGAIAATIIAVAAVAGGLWQRQIRHQTEELARLYNYVADINLAYRGLQERNPILAQRALAATHPPADTDDLRGIEWGLTQRLLETASHPPWFHAEEPLLAIALRADGSRIGAIGTRHAFILDGSGQLLHRWDCKASQTHASRSDPSQPDPDAAAIGRIAFSPDGDSVVIGTSTQLQKFSLSSQIRTSLATGSVSTVEFSRDGRWLAAAIDVPPSSYTAELFVFDARNDSVRRHVPIHTIATAWQADGSLRFVNGRAQVRELSPESESIRVLNSDGYRSPTAALSPENNFLLRTSIYGIALVVDLRRNAPVDVIRTLPGETVCSAFNSDGNLLAITTDEGNVRLVPTGGESTSTNRLLRELAPGHAAPISSLAFSSSHRAIFTAARDGTIRRIELDSPPRQPHITLEHHLPAPAPHPPSFNRSSSKVALVDTRIYADAPENGISMIWDTQQRTVVGTVSGEILGWGANDTALAWNRKGSLTVWDLRDAAAPQRLSTFQVQTNAHLTVAPEIAEHGRWIVSVTRDGHAEAFDVAQMKVTHRIHPSRLPPVPAGETYADYLATSPVSAFAGLGCAHGGAVLWDILADRIIPLQSQVLADIHFSSDGSLIGVSDYTDNHVRLFDGRTGEQRGVFSGHQGPVLSFAFSPDGRQVVTGGNDSTVVVWNIATGREAFRHKLNSPIPWISMSHDLRWLVTGHLPDSMGLGWNSLNLGSYQLWPLPVPDSKLSESPRPTTEAADSVWRRHEELARRFPAP